ncbi:MAG: OmpA family protein [Bacteroidales bacterium]|nr:OmpA family protein [Bacteroidales bacterium]
MKKAFFLLSVCALMFPVNILAQRDTDIEGGKDHPLISRFEGSVIEFYEHKNYDEYTLVLGFDEEEGQVDEVLNVEGEITRIQYSTKGDHSVFEIYKNYELALESANFNTLFTWSEKMGNPDWQFWFYNYYGEINKMVSEYDHPDGRMGFRYHVASGINEGRNVYIVLYISSDDDTDWILTTMDVIEEKEMMTGLVTARSIEKGLQLSGHSVLSGLLFDTGEATIKPESEPALKNIAEYLKANPDKNFFIVGHTDNVGDFDNNMTLSESRAKAVMDKLVSAYGVDAGQLKAYGVSSLSPVASNMTEEGKARNRRVEIVEE